MSLNSLMNNINAIMNSVTTVEFEESGRSTNSEYLRASSPELVEIEVPRQISRYYPDASNNLVRNPTSTSLPEASPANSSNSASNAIQSNSREIDPGTSNQNDFDPKKFDPTNLSFKETCKRLAACDLDKHIKFVRDTILKYSLSIIGFPDCPDEDLMLAVYFHFEEQFEIKANFELCVRYDHHNQKNVVGVILDSIQTREEILNKTIKAKRSKIRTFANGAFHWILDGFCGH